jgi:uncharacterized RDD family membrane protein YckC
MLDERVDIHRERDPFYPGASCPLGRNESILKAETNSIVTPEAVAVRVDIAELGSRVGAGLIDVLIIAGVLLVLSILTAVTGALGILSIGGGLGAGLYAGFIVLLILGYHPFFEEIWNGRTPGKRAFGLLVIQTDGQPVGLGPVLLRALFRPVDVVVGLGLFLILLTRRRQRLGDLVAGTIVVRQPKMAPPAPVALGIPPDAELPPLDTTLLTEEEYELIRSFLERRWQLEPGARMALGNQLGNLAWSKVPGAQNYVWGPEILLEAVLVTVQRRSREAEGRRWSSTAPPLPGAADAPPAPVDAPPLSPFENPPL